MLATVFGVLSALFAESPSGHDASAQIAEADISLTDWVAEDI